MDAVGKALWFIENELGDELTLDLIASTCDLSRFSLSRVFTTRTGWPAMRYVRARRLTRAAHALAGGAPDILGVALDAGYGSHEAFTRAFHDQFGATPEQVRSQRSVVNLPLVEPLRMKALKLIDLPPPRFESIGPLCIGGLAGRFTFETNEGIPALWQSFEAHIGHVPGQVGGVTYGVCCHPDPDGGFDYLAGVEVADPQRLPPPLRGISLAPRRYAVFEHRGHVSTVHQTCYSIWHGWLPDSGWRAAAAPEFERYSADFDPVRETGTLEIWIPVEDGAPTRG
ncbi:AraC family transcriptional regulator [Burkholderia alba]|uniref:AraC family transcriptional regulator n=1 Tax=Burkholderia alba TaxID=2683677 RepID=UPI002B06137D|nr:AraC family transcriptional regulator [Burkholderia alba]